MVPGPSRETILNTIGVGGRGGGGFQMGIGLWGFRWVVAVSNFLRDFFFQEMHSRFSLLPFPFQCRTP